MPNKIDYVGIRAIMERVGNQKGLEELVLNFLKTELENPSSSSHSFFKGLLLSDELITKLNNASLIYALESGAEPQEQLIHKVLDNHIENAFILYKNGIITLKILEEKIFERNDSVVYAVFYLLNDGDLTLYEGLNFEELETRFAASWPTTKYDKDLFTTALWYMMKVPYNRGHLKLARSLVALTASIETAKEKRDTFQAFEDFFHHGIIGSASIEETIEILKTRPDCLHLIKNIPTANEAFLSIFDRPLKDQTLKSVMEELKNKIVRGQLSSIGFALYLFEPLFEKRIDILNEWVANDKTIEVDIYANVFIKGLIPYEELDATYERIKNETEEEEYKHFMIEKNATE